MPSAKTRPEKIVDKNGVLTTRHKSIDTGTADSVARISSVAVKPQPKSGVDISAIAAGQSVEHGFNNEIFSKATITRAADGKLTAVGEVIIDEEALDDLREEVGNLGTYLAANSEDIKSFISSEYGASSVKVNAADESIVVLYETSLGDDEKLDADHLLDSLYETRASSLHSHAYSSDRRLGVGISEFVSTTDTEYVEARSPRFAFDDEA